MQYHTVHHYKIPLEDSILCVEMALQYFFGRHVCVNPHEEEICFPHTWPLNIFYSGGVQFFLYWTILFILRMAGWSWHGYHLLNLRPYFQFGENYLSNDTETTSIIITLHCSNFWRPQTILGSTAVIHYTCAIVI